MLGYTNMDSEKGFLFFQKFMKEQGILKDLEAQGIEDGDTVRMYGFEFDYYRVKRRKQDMELTSKQRAYLGGCKHLRSNLQIGKASLTPEIIQALDEALEKRELIKISVLKNCADDPREIAQVIAERTHSAVVKVIGKKIILFRQAKKTASLNFRHEKDRNFRRLV